MQGKAAVVTGASNGVGRATALELARRGCAVLVNYASSEREAHEVCQEIAALGVEALPFQADVSDDDACRRMIDAAASTFGRLDVLVNNAGTTRFINHRDLDAVKDDDWDRIFGVNLKGAFQCARAAREPMLAHGGGAIVNVTSVAGIRGLGSSIPYAASKAALNNLTLTLAKALAPEIRVNAVAPGFIAGRWLQKGLGPAYDTVLKAMEDRVPLGKVSQPEDVAAAILSLITGSNLITGQILVCDGGMLIAD
ncbi:MAG: glucose 1-dehydrogenase [Planctomycetaceae bacterium]|nr:glucose 1-dehydrogenase [Planctomycetaceae bacterium]